MGIVYLDGAFMDVAAARVSPLDRGFLFADGVYEVIPCYRGHGFHLGRHLARLAYSLAQLRIDNPHDDAGWRALLGALVARNGGGDLSVYLQVTRGNAGRRDHAFPAGIAPTVFAMTSPLPRSVVDDAAAAVATACISAPDPRWARCDIKAIALLPNVLARQQAVDNGASECIFLRDGCATEGAASNLFIVRDGVLVTPPLSPHILAGITRAVLLVLARRHGIAVQERDIPIAELRQADEVWLASSLRELVPVGRIDGVAVGDGRPGPLWQRMAGIFRDYTQGPFHDQDGA